MLKSLDLTGYSRLRTRYHGSQSMSLLSGNKAGLNRALAGILFCKLMSFDHFLADFLVGSHVTRTKAKALRVRSQIFRDPNWA